MKRKSLVAILLALVLCFTMALTACKDDNDDPPVGGGKTPPTASQWADAGISGTFTADVKGELALSVVDNGEISMKWTGSDEASLDNMITWLKGQGFTSYGGQNAEKSTEEGGKIKSYTAEKTVNGVNPVSASADGGYSVVPLSFTLTASADESKRMIAETFYITEDFSIMGVDFKAGELYLDIYEASGSVGGSSLLTAWPTNQIQTALGTSIPAYTGTASGYQFVDSSAAYMKTVQIYVFEAGEADATAYKAILAQNGYAADEETYSKTLANGDVVEIMAFASQTYHPDTFQIVNALSITVVLEKNSGAYTSWNSLDLSVFNGAGIPAYSGGTSFDLDNAAGSGIDLSQYEQIVNSLGAIEGMLDDESRADLEEARRYIALASEIKAYVITVYGTNATQADAYENALTAAGFANGLKNVTDYQFQVEIGENDGKVMIAITKLPIELAEEIDEGGSGNQGGNTPVENEKLDFSDLPTNIKFTLVDVNNSQYTVTKIGNDYLIDTLGVISCLKYSGTEWVEYTYFDGTWTENTEDTYSQLKYHSFMSVVSDVLFDNEVSDFSQGANEQIAGQACEVYTLEDNSMASYGLTTTSVRKLNEDGFVFYHSEIYYMNGQLYMTTTYQITLWDTSVTEFDIAVPQ